MYELMTPEEFSAKYPPRGVWGFQHRGTENGVDYNYAGYCTDRVKTCPVCGRLPVFTESYYHATPKDERAKVFYGYCPTCSLRTKEPGTLKEAVYQWQRREFSDDTWLVCHRPKLSGPAVRALSQKVIESAIEDAIFYARKRQDLQEGSDAWKSYGRQLQELETFFRTSVFMYEMSASGIISDIRRILYPDAEPKDRIKIPLHLDQLYKGKEILKECTAQNNSKKRPRSEDMRGLELYNSGCNRTQRKNIQKTI